MKTYLLLSLMVGALAQVSICQYLFKNMISKKEFQEYGLALEAVFGLGFRLRALLDKSSNENFVVSPLSATVIIAELMLGAEGEFSRQLFELFSLPGVPTTSFIHFNNKRNETYILPYAHIHLQLSSLIKKLKKKSGEQFILDQNSALFYSKDIDLKSYFKRNMYRFYDGEIFPLDFSTRTASIINNWALNHTNGLIRNILTSEPPPSTTSVFLNSIYFKANWETPFADSFNVNDTFNIDEQNTVQTTYMLGLVEQITYVQNKNYRIICLPYSNKELGMYIVIPNADNPLKYNIKDFLETLNFTDVFDSIKQAKVRNVVVKIPKLSLSSTLSILEPLQKYAEYKKVGQMESRVGGNVIDNIFEKISAYKNFTSTQKKDIYLTGAAHNASLKVSDVVQQMVFAINEKGTEAAAVSAGITDYSGGSKTVLLNRPFMFFIRHEATLATIFWGTISNPTQH